MASLTLSGNVAANLAALKDGSVSSLRLELSEALSDAVLDAVVRVLAPGGALELVSAASATSPVDIASSKRDLLFAGLANVNVVGQVATASKPAVAVGTSAPLKFAPGPSPAPASASSSTSASSSGATSAWSLSAADLAEEDLVDEASLLARDPIEAKPVYDCGTGSGPRKACKNCSCGLADEEQAQAAAASRAAMGMDAAAPPPGGPGSKTKSSCGNCSLGDAFRCAGCPSLGLPAWKEEGDKVKIVL